MQISVICVNLRQSTGIAKEHSINNISIVMIVGKFTRSSADADNGLDAFSGQSRSTNIVPFHILGIVSYCAVVTSVFKTLRLYDIRLQKIS